MTPSWLSTEAGRQQCQLHQHCTGLLSDSNSNSAALQYHHRCTGCLYKLYQTLLNHHQKCGRQISMKLRIDTTTIQPTNPLTHTTSDTWQQVMSPSHRLSRRLYYGLWIHDNKWTLTNKSMTSNAEWIYSGWVIIQATVNVMLTTVHCVQKKNTCSVSFISPWIMCRLKQKFPREYLRNDRFWQYRN